MHVKYDSRHALYPVPNVFVPVPDTVGFDVARATVLVAVARALVVGCVALRDDCAGVAAALRDTVLVAVARALVAGCVALSDDWAGAVAARDTVFAAAARAATDVPAVRFVVVAVRALVVVRWDVAADGDVAVRATVAPVDWVRFTLVASRTAASAKPMHAHAVAIKSKIFLILVD